MDPEIYKAAISGDINVLRENSEKLENEVTKTNNTVLHLASQLGHVDCVAEILVMAPSLLLKLNSRDETALHLAARNGHANVCIKLIDSARNTPAAEIKSGVGAESAQHTPAAEMESGVGAGATVKEMLWMQDKEKDTALHLAARNNFHEVVGLLTKEDPHQPHPSNSLGENPLYLAASRGHTLVIGEILEKCKSPGYNGPNGATALHAAVISKSEECVVKLLGWDKSLTRTTDEAGQTPLHYAALVGYSETVEELMLVDKSCAYIQDGVGKNTAFYLAASRGHSKVMERMASFCPDLWDMANGEKLQNVLHVAVDQDRKRTVEFILDKCPVISSIINQKDVDGNTPFHLIATSLCFVLKFVRHPLVDKRALNNKRLTAFDLINSTQHYQEQAANKALFVLAMRRVGASCSFQKTIGNNQDNEFNPYRFTAMEYDKDVDSMRKMGDNHMIVAALVATVAFTAAITLPGGYNGNEGHDMGLGILRKKGAFKIFVASDCMALVFSLTAIGMYFSASSCYNRNGLVMYYDLGAGLLYLSIVAILVAFFAGIFATLASSNMAYVLIFISLLLYYGFHRLVNKLLWYFSNSKRMHEYLYEDSALV